MGTSPGSTSSGLQIGFDGAGSYKIAQWNDDQSYSLTYSANTDYIMSGKKIPINGGSALWQTGTLVGTGTKPNTTLAASDTFY